MSEKKTNSSKMLEKIRKMNCSMQNLDLDSQGMLFGDENDRFVLKKCSSYLARHLTRYPFFQADTFNLLCWVLGEKKEILGRYLLARLNPRDKKAYAEELLDAASCYKDYAHVLDRMLTRCPRAQLRDFPRKTIRLLKEHMENLDCSGLSDIETHAKMITAMFHLTECETEFCILLFMISSYEPVEDFLVRFLECNRFSGKKYLSNILNLSRAELNEVLEGTLKKINLIEADRFDLRLTDEFLAFFQKPCLENVSKDFFAPVPNKTIPLSHHFVPEKKIRFLVKLLKNSTETPTHVLLYGPPGTGKTTFACGLIKKVGMPGYSVAHDEANMTRNRRAAILACLNLTNRGRGSVILVDEADNLLNTKDSWFSRGENQDKGWLNRFLETAGVRMIWITNRIDDIEDSVLRRFAFNIRFSRLTVKQRQHLWKNIVKTNRAGRYFDESTLLQLAEKYDLSAGAIDLAVKKTMALRPASKEQFHNDLKLALDAGYALAHAGEKTPPKARTERCYSCEGLNVDGTIEEIIQDLERYDAYLRSDKKRSPVTMNCLFYGPPGSGKSELARHIGFRLKRKPICKRLSDLLNPYVGISEKNIKNAFSLAEKEEAVLIMDEIESLLYSRDRAVHSWELSLTNEFLTQMERFRGLLICTTNRIKDLDEASLRRFTFKLKFDFLLPEGNVAFYERLIQPLLPEPINPKIRNQLQQIPCLTPGDFKTVRDRFFFYPKNQLDHQKMIRSLKQEVEIKKRRQ